MDMGNILIYFLESESSLSTHWLMQGSKPRLLIGFLAWGNTPTSYTA